MNVNIYMWAGVCMERQGVASRRPSSGILLLLDNLNTDVESSILSSLLTTNISTNISNLKTMMFHYVASLITATSNFQAKEGNFQSLALTVDFSW